MIYGYCRVCELGVIMARNNNEFNKKASNHIIALHTDQNIDETIITRVEQ